MAKVTFRVAGPNDPIFKEPWTITPIRKYSPAKRRDQQRKNAKDSKPKAK